MVPAVFFILVFLTGATWSKRVCRYQDVVDYLNISTNPDLFRLSRPVQDHTQQTIVELDLLLYSILAVIEKTQTFIPFIWVTMNWNNEFIYWDPKEFCGIERISLPKEMLWKPDLFIYEMTQKDDSPKNPYMYVTSDGTVSSEEDINVVSTCRMDVHKFPFDTQSCNISVGSAIHSTEELHLVPYANSTRATEFSRDLMKSQGEWEFLHIAINSKNFSYGPRMWEQLIYTFTVKRRPLLHVINFLLPILFFLVLDLASFFISDLRGEKLGFKVTVLLAISVLLLILNEILPSMSNRTPLIATYCIVIFALMLLSLLETILVIYLMELDSQQQQSLKDDVAISEECKTENNGPGCFSCVYKTPGGERENEMLPMSEKANRFVQSRETRVLLLILDELKELKKSLCLQQDSRAEGGRFSVWATRINRAFFVCYVTTVLLFLPLLFNEWSH